SVCGNVEGTLALGDARSSRDDDKLGVTVALGVSKISVGLNAEVLFVGTSKGHWHLDLMPKFCLSSRMRANRHQQVTVEGIDLALEVSLPNESHYSLLCYPGGAMSGPYLRKLPLMMKTGGHRPKN
ncbi:10936_t:CDS:2, partial [Acaulospora morrowiae]